MIEVAEQRPEMTHTLEALTLAQTKSNAKRGLAVVALILLVACGVGLTWKVRSAAPRPNTIISVGRALPSLVVEDQFGHAVDLRGVKSGVRRVIAFYSPSCEVCQREMPELTPFPRGLELVMVNEGPRIEVDPFVSTSGIASRFKDPHGSFKKAFAMPALPTILFIDERGIVRDGLVGAHATTTTQRKLQSFARDRR